MEQHRSDVVVHFSQPVRQIVMMVLVLVLLGLGVYVMLPRVAPLFLANPYLNGFIALVFVIGVLACFWQVVQLIASVNWIERFTGFRPKGGNDKAPRLLAPLAALMRGREANSQISSTSARSILDSVATRIDEARDITRYLVNLLIFLGLLGTFFGLATTVPAMVDTIRSLAPTEGEGGVQVFSRLMGGLEAQLGGMGTAFSSSLLGLFGSLVVGMLELFASHGQNRFFRELEEWMSSITRIGFAGDSDGDTSAATAVLDHMSGQIDRMRILFSEARQDQASVDARLMALAGTIEKLTERLDADGQASAAMHRVADGQEKLAAILTRQAEDAAGQVDAESRMRLRSIDVQLLRILEELSAGRQETMGELRADLAALTKAIRAQQGR
ncbi:biopolymer transporter ExbB [Aliiroseovarius sp. PTFE2010]|uniref:biopolymer transporter ExbB n=1 Tax=Aliiroseovarius sp. PTFE2010 TaxID=3417190 RepID=UPI003CF5146F